MSVSSADFLASASALKKSGAEIDFRNCVSRAYYSAYHAARPIAESHFPDPNAHLRMGDHERLSERFKAARTKSALSVTYILEFLKRERRRADYDLGAKFNEHDAEQSLTKARDFAGHLANCISTATPASNPMKTTKGTGAPILLASTER